MTKAAAKEKTLFGEVEPPKVRDLMTEETKTVDGKIISHTKKKNPTAKPAPAKPQPEPKTGVRGGYTGGGSGKKPKLPTTGSGVAVCAPAKPLANVTPLNMLAVLANAAGDPKCEPAKMRELYAIHKEMAADQAKIDFIRDFAALQAENLHINAKGKIVIPAKDGRAGQSTPYAKFNDITKAIKPLLKKHHFTLSFETEPSTDASRLIVKGRLAHDHGHERVTAFPLPAETSGSKNNVQGWGSSMSYGKRYCTIALLNLTSEAMEDEDDDGAAAGKADPTKIVQAAEPDVPKTLTVDQTQDLLALIKSSGVGLERFLEKYNLKGVIDLPQSRLVEATNALNNYAKNNKAAT